MTRTTVRWFYSRLLSIPHCILIYSYSAGFELENSWSRRNHWDQLTRKLVLWSHHYLSSFIFGWWSNQWLHKSQANTMKPVSRNYFSFSSSSLSSAGMDSKSLQSIPKHQMALRHRQSHALLIWLTNQSAGRARSPYRSIQMPNNGVHFFRHVERVHWCNRKSAQFYLGFNQKVIGRY